MTKETAQPPRVTTRGKIAELPVGGVLEYPIHKVTSIRSAASDAGIASGKRFRTEADRRQGVVRVIRDA